MKEQYKAKVKAKNKDGEKLTFKAKVKAKNPEKAAKKILKRWQEDLEDEGIRFELNGSSLTVGNKEVKIKVKAAEKEKFFPEDIEQESKDEEFEPEEEISEAEEYGPEEEHDGEEDDFDWER